MYPLLNDNDNVVHILLILTETHSWRARIIRNEFLRINEKIA